MKCDKVIEKIKEGLEQIKNDREEIQKVAEVIKKLRPCDNTKINYEFMIKQYLIMVKYWDDMANLLNKHQKDTLKVLKLQENGRIPPQ